MVEKKRKMIWQDLLLLAGRSILENRLRSFLTILGLTIGVMSLITVMTVIQGANDYVANKIANLGTNVFQVTKLANISNGIDAFIRSFRRKDITWDDYLYVRDRLTSAWRVGAQSSTAVKVHFGNESIEDTTIEGVTANMIDIGTREIEDGRFFSDQEQLFARRVCVIGWEVKDKLFAGIDPVGKYLKVGELPYLVVGVCKQIGNIVGVTQDNFVMVPLPVFSKQFGQRRSLDLFVQTRSPKDLDTAMEQARLLMRVLRNRKYNQDDDFTILTSDTTIELFHTITDNFALVFLMLTAVAAIVGGIVIMNIMLVSVTERTMEIGVRRATGGTRLDILSQFLAESLVLCAIGGILGVALGFISAAIFNQFAGMTASIKAWVAGVGVGLSSLIGLFFGIYPAWKAAGLDPVEALRQEK